MQRSRLKNIINKSKAISAKQEVGNPFDEFKKSLPIEVDDNYRLEAAWKAYGSPKDYKAAVWEGLIQPIDENTYKLPSIGYNEETDEYEYLNKGEDNETVAKDIRVWDNDVIPLVQELKLGGYVRTFNEEKDCWTYTKNSLKREEPALINELQVIKLFKKGGKNKKPKYQKSQESYYDPETDTIYAPDKNGEFYIHEYYGHARPDLKLLEFILPYYKDLNDLKILELGGDLKFFEGKDKNDYYGPLDIMGRLYAAYNLSEDYEHSPEFFEKIRNTNENYFGDNFRDLLHMYNNEILSKLFSYFDNKKNSSYNEFNGFGGGGEGLRDVPFEDAIYTESGIAYKTDELAEDGLYYYETDDGYRYTKYPPNQAPQAFKQGGQMNVIPEGALHARKNNMEGAGEDFTAKGIPVVDNNGEQQAEIERNEVILTKNLTEFIEDNLKKFSSEETNNSEKDEIAIKVGKRLVKELLTNTDDRTGLIEEVELKMS